MGGAESVVRNADKRTSRREHRATFEAAVARFRATPFESTAQASRGSRSAPSRSIRVCVRKRPLFVHEQQQGEFDVISCLPGRVVIHDARMKADMRHMLMNHHDFNFHDVYAETADNEAVYHDTVGGLVSSVLEGGHATLMMYGQTGSGKTYTMRAIHERIAGDIFPRGCSVTMSFVELLGDNCFDMLNGGTPCSVVTGPDGSVHPFPCVEVPVAGPSEFQALVDMAAKLRATAATGVHDQSSRSHAVCRIFVIREDELLREGSLTLVDLAGTEHRVDNAEHNADRQKEGARINASLAALKECVRASAGGSKFISYRRNRLTQLLRGCFSSEHSTVIIATVSPSSKDTEQSLNTLRHACIMDGQGEAKTNGSTHVTGGVTTQEDLGEINVTKIAREQAAKRRAAQNGRPNDRAVDDGFKVAPAHQAKQSNVVRRRQLDRRLQEALAPSLAKELLAARGCSGTSRQRARLERPVVAIDGDEEEPAVDEVQADVNTADVAAPCEAGAGNNLQFPDRVTSATQRRPEGERSLPASPSKAPPVRLQAREAVRFEPSPELHPGRSSSCSTRVQPQLSPTHAEMSIAPSPQLAEADAGAGVAPPCQPGPPSKLYVSSEDSAPGQHSPQHKAVQEVESAKPLSADAHGGYDLIFEKDVDGRHSEHARRTEESMDSERGKALSLFRHFCREGRSARIWRKNDLRLINTCVVPELFGRFQIDWAHPQKGLDELEKLVREYPLPDHVWHVLADPPQQFKQHAIVREGEVEVGRPAATPKLPATALPKKDSVGAPPGKMSPRGLSPRSPSGLPPSVPGSNSPSGYPLGGDRSPRLMGRVPPEGTGDRSPRPIPRMPPTQPPPEVTGDRSPRLSGRMMSPEVTGRSIRSPREMPEALAKGEVDAMRRARSSEVQEEQIAHLERQVASTEDGVKRWLGELRAQASQDRQSPPRQPPKTGPSGADLARPCARKAPPLPSEQQQHRFHIRR